MQRTVKFSCSVTDLKALGITSLKNSVERSSQTDHKSETESQFKKQTKRKKSVQQEREERVEQSLEALKKKYSGSHTQMQYRIWEECIVNGLGTLDNATPPPVPCLNELEMEVVLVRPMPNQVMHP